MSCTVTWIVEIYRSRHIFHQPSSLTITKLTAQFTKVTKYVCFSETSYLQTIFSSLPPWLATVSQSHSLAPLASSLASLCNQAPLVSVTSLAASAHSYSPDLFWGTTSRTTPKLLTYWLLEILVSHQNNETAWKISWKVLKFILSPWLHCSTYQNSIHNTKSRDTWFHVHQVW